MIFAGRNFAKSGSAHGQAAPLTGTKQEQTSLGKTETLDMTTIAYKDGVIAYDSRATAGDIILDDSYDKSLEYEGAKFFLAGAISDFQKFVECYIHDRKPPKDMDVCAFVLYDNCLWKASVDNMGLWKHKLDVNKSYAIGNGEQFALAAMDLGKNAKDAIIAAKKRDTKTGGQVRTFEIKGYINEQFIRSASENDGNASEDLENLGEESETRNCGNRKKSRDIGKSCTTPCNLP